MSERAPTEMELRCLERVRMMLFENGILHSEPMSNGEFRIKKTMPLGIVVQTVIRAMREPTDEMIRAAEDTNTGGGVADGGGGEPDEYDPEAVWQTMITAASPPDETK